MATGQFLSGITIPAGAIGNLQISNQTADIINTDKVQPVFTAATNFGQAIGATPATREEIVYVGKIGGTVRGISALLNDTGSSTGITFDLKKNGTTILSSVASITNADADRAVKTGTLSASSFSAGDVFSILMTVTTSTGAQGPYAWATFVENTAPLT